MGHFMTITAVNTYMKFDTSSETAIHIPVVTNLQSCSVYNGIVRLCPGQRPCPPRQKKTSALLAYNSKYMSTSLPVIWPYI